MGSGVVKTNAIKGENAVRSVCVQQNQVPPRPLLWIVAPGIPVEQLLNCFLMVCCKNSSSKDFCPCRGNHTIVIWPFGRRQSSTSESSTVVYCPDAGTVSVNGVLSPLLRAAFGPDEWHKVFIGGANGAKIRLAYHCPQLGWYRAFKPQMIFVLSTMWRLRQRHGPILPKI